MDELHLDIIIDHLRRESQVDVNIGSPQVACRETITRRHKQDFTHKRQSGGTCQFARVKIMFEPIADSADFVFESRIAGGALHGEYIAGVEKGLRSILSSGPLAGFPMIGVKAVLMDGAFHDADSSALAFEIAGRACFREAAPRLGVQLLEPIMKVEVMTSATHVGNVVAELHSRRGQILSREIRGVVVVVNATVPLRNMSKLEDVLRSCSNGQARLNASYAGYIPVPLPPGDGDPPAAMAIA